MASSIDNENALVTLDEVKAFIGSTDSEDDIVERLINAASWRANKEADRQLKRRTLTEYYNGDGSNLLLVRNYPIQSITSIYMDSDREFGSDTLVDADNYQIDPETESMIWFTGTVLLSGIRVVKVTYSAGYGEVPWDLRESVLELVMYWYKEITDKRIGVASIGREGRNIAYTHKVPKDVLEMFWQYRKVMVA